MRGRFIVLEGVEGSGKTTQVARLAARLESRGIDHVTAREPGGTALGEAIRTVVLERPELDVPPESELLLVLAARAAFVREVVEPALAAGSLVVADRFALSTLAYQGRGRGLDLDQVRRLNAFATRGLRPDAYVVLDLPAGEGLERQRRGGKAGDRIESEGPRFLETVADAYRELAAVDPTAHLVDARGSPEQVEGRIVALLARLFPETFPDAQV